MKFLPIFPARNDEIYGEVKSG